MSVSLANAHLRAPGKSIESFEQQTHFVAPEIQNCCHTLALQTVCFEWSIIHEHIFIIQGYIPKIPLNQTNQKKNIALKWNPSHLKTKKHKPHPSFHPGGLRGLCLSRIESQCCQRQTQHYTAAPSSHRDVCKVSNPPINMLWFWQMICLVKTYRMYHMVADDNRPKFG